VRRLLLIGIGIILNISMVNSAEIQAFGFLGAEGKFNLDYLSEDNFLESINPDDAIPLTQTKQLRTVTQENLEVLFHTFIYHPNFAKFDFGFGLVLTQNEVADSGNKVEPKTERRDDSAIDLNFRLSFFEKKDYPFSIFYVSKHPSISSVSTDAFISETTRYGINAAWNAPIKINFDAIHYQVNGESNLRIVNDEVDSTSISAYKSFKNDGHSQLSYSHQSSSSKSGSTLEPIVAAKNIIDSLVYDGRYNYGESREYTINLNSSYRQTRKSFEYNELVISPSFDWTHSEKVKSNYRYSFVNNEYAEITNRTHTANAGVAYTETTGFSSRLDANVLRNELTGANTTVYGLQSTSGYRQSYKHASISSTLLLGVTQSDTVTNFTGIGIKSFEFVKMPAIGADPVVLKNTNIVSIININNDPDPDGKYIKVTRVEGSVLLAYNIDYIIRDLGNGRFDIAYVANSGKVSPGDNLLIEYKVNLGKTNSYRKTIVGINSSVQFFNYFNIFGGVFESDVEILEGQVSNTLVQKRTVVNSGGGFDYPLFDDFVLIGGELRNETVDEVNADNKVITTISASEFAYMQLQLFRGASLYGSRRHSTVKYSGAITNSNDSDKLAYRALLKIQTSNRTNLSLIYDESKDIGNITDIKEITQSSLRFEWGYRRILLNMTGSKLKDKRGTTFRERTAFQLNFVRTF